MKATLLFIVVLYVVEFSWEQTTQCKQSPPYDDPTIDMDSDPDYILIGTSNCPPYDNPNWSNPNNALDQNLNLKIPKNPKYAKTPIPVGEELSYYDGVRYLKNDPAPILGLIGVLENGVVLYGMGSPCGVGKDSAPCPSTDSQAPSNYVDAFESEGHTFDQCGGHPSNMNGRYHIHSAASFINTTGRTMCDLPTDNAGDHSVRLGWMLDGFAIYGQYSQGGQLPTQLDACHGHTHEIDGVMTYHYHMPTGFPYVTGCFKGCAEASNNQMEFGKFNGDSTYGCPAGQSTDPDPLYEVYATQSTGSPATATSSVSKSQQVMSASVSTGPTATGSPTASPTDAAGYTASSVVIVVGTVILSISWMMN